VLTQVLLHFLRVNAQMCKWTLAKNGARPETVRGNRATDISFDKKYIFDKTLRHGKIPKRQRTEFRNRKNF